MAAKKEEVKEEVVKEDTVESVAVPFDFGRADLNALRDVVNDLAKKCK